MDLKAWLDTDWSDFAKYEEFQKLMEADLQEQCATIDLQVIKFLPNRFLFGAVVANAARDRFVHVTIPDVRKGADWYEQACTRRMSSERDWKGDAFHYAPWPQIAALAAEIMKPEYDDEIL